VDTTQLDARLSGLDKALVALNAKIDRLLLNEPVADYLTVKQAAKHFQISASVLYREMKHLQIRRGRSVRFRRRDLELALRRNPLGDA
jgi:hypothetical protein